MNKPNFLQRIFALGYVAPRCGRISIGALLAIQLCVAHGEPPEADVLAMHDRLLTLDSHLDTPLRVALPGFDIRRQHDPLKDYSHIDLPRIRAGKLDGGFWVIYSPQLELSEDGYRQSYLNALRRLAVIKKMVAQNPSDFALATTAADAQRINKLGRHIVYLSIENAYPLGLDIARLQYFYDQGVRMLGLVHKKNNQFADSSTDAAGPRWNGLSPLGVELVKEANRLGMIVDGSHASDLALEQMIQVSSTPVILSHSGAAEVFDHPRNVNDRLLRKVADAGGVIQMNSLAAYLKDFPKPSPERLEALGRFIDDFRAAENADSPMPFDEFRNRLLAIDKAYPKPIAVFDDYMSHFLHVLKIVGPANVGVGADWDGGGGVAGMADVSMIATITERLMRDGYDEPTLNKIWSGNLLRVLDIVDRSKSVDVRANLPQQ